jgi:hypothetical protein
MVIAIKKGYSWGHGGNVAKAKRLAHCGRIKILDRFDSIIIWDLLFFAEIRSGTISLWQIWGRIMPFCDG